MKDSTKDIIIAFIASGACSAIVSFLISIAQSRLATRQILYFLIKKDAIDSINKGYISNDSLEAICESWETYHNKLKGNGYLDALMAKVRALRINDEY